MHYHLRKGKITIENEIDGSIFFSIKDFLFSQKDRFARKMSMM